MFYRRRGFCVLLPSLARTLVLEKGHKQTRATVDQAAFSSLLLPQERTLWLRRGEDPGPPRPQLWQGRGRSSSPIGALQTCGVRNSPRSPLRTATRSSSRSSYQVFGSPNQNNLDQLRNCRVSDKTMLPSRFIDQTRHTQGVLVVQSRPVLSRLSCPTGAPGKRNKRTS